MEPAQELLAEKIEPDDRQPHQAERREDAPDVEFRRFVAQRWRALARYAYVLTGDHHAAEDVVQAALEKCWRRWRHIEGSSPEAYVRAAIANVAASRRRRRTVPESPPDALEFMPADGAIGRDPAEGHLLRSGLWSALAELPPRQRAVVVLRVWEDRSEAETAKVLGITAGAVKSQLSKGMAKLRVHPAVRDLGGRTNEGEGIR